MKQSFSETKLRRVCRELENRIRDGERSLVEEYLAKMPELQNDDDALIDLIYCEYLALEAVGELPTPADLTDRFPNHVGQLSKLLEVHGAIANEMAENPTSIAMSDVQDLNGQTIGNYKLLQEIGEGGFGIVYMAQQVQPVRRQVAIKIIKPGMDTREALARFESERQALALMDHPNVCRVLEAGATDDGYPYFVMELVKGLPITAYCKKQKVSIRERLELFQTVCSAVQHAHSKGIIHRDLKPSNVMITFHDTVPVPKVIDFGIAKALNQQLTEKTLFTRYGQLLGTPMYMSPEQAEFSGLDIDIRSDVYSLGVMLYELLTGTPPFTSERFKTATYADMVKIIAEEDPPTPSTRLQASTKSGKATELIGIQSRDLSREIQGDLDRIVMKALEKDRRLRYETVNDLSRDVERFLNDEPVSAAGTNNWSRMRRFVRRNKAAVTAGTVVLVAMVVGLIISTIGLVKASQAIERERLAKLDEQTQRLRAEEQERRKTEALNLEKLQRQRLEQSLYQQRIQAVRESLDLQTSSESVSQLQKCPKSLRGWEWDYLMQKATSGLKTLGGHDLTISRAKFSPDGRWILSASGEWNDSRVGKAILWNAKTFEVQNVLYEEKGGVFDLAFSQDSKLLAIANGNGGGVTVVHVPSGNRKLIRGQGRRIYAVDFDSQAERLAFAGADRQISILDVESNQIVQRFDLQAVFDLSFSPDDLYLAATSS